MRDALESSTTARVFWDKKARERNEGVSTKSCSKIQKMGCHALAGAKPDTELQIVNDLMQEANNQCLIPKTASISFKKRKRTPDKMLSFVVWTLLI